MDIEIKLQGLSGATLGNLVVNSNCSIGALKSQITDQLSLPAWHMHVLFGTAQLKDQQTLEELDGNATSSGSLELTLILDSEQVLSELKLKEELYRSWEALRQLTIQTAELREYCDSWEVSKLNEYKLSELESYMQTTSLSLSQEKSCLKQVQELTKKLREAPQDAAEYRRRDAQLTELYTAWSKQRQEAHQAKLKLEAITPEVNKSSKFAYLWLKNSDSHVLHFDLFSMPDVLDRPDGESNVSRYPYHSFGPQGPTLYSTCHYWPTQDDDYDTTSDYVPEEVVHFKLSKSRHRFEGWGRAR